MPEYEENTTEEIIEFFTNLFRLMLGDTEDVSQWLSFDNQKASAMLPSNDGSDDSFNLNRHPFLIVIDNAHRMDKVSWLMFYSLMSDCTNFAIVMLMQTDDLDRIKIKDEVASEFEKVITNLIENLDHSIIEKELPRLDQETLNKLITSSAYNYKRSYSGEMKEMTKIKDVNKTIKTQEMGAQWK